MIRFEDRQCTLCGPSAGKKVKYPPNFTPEDLNAAIFSARRMPDRRHFRLVECEDCGIIFSDPSCETSQLADLYEKGLVNYSNQEEQIYQSYAPVLDRALKLCNRRGSFVEIGGGRGFMLRYGAENGFTQQIEVEPSSDAERKFVPSSGNSKFIRDILKKDTLPPQSASLICFFQMLDHVPNPKAFLDTVFETLEPGGVAVSVTHNTKAMSAKLLGERSPIFDIEHTYLFNPDNMSRLFNKVGFEAVDTFSISNNYSIRHWLHMAPAPKGTKKAILNALESLSLADTRIRIKAGNFGVIGRKPGKPL